MPGTTLEHLAPEHAVLGVVNPATGERFAEVPACTGVELDEAFAAAAAAQPDRAADESRRRALLRELAQAIPAAGDELAVLLISESGKLPGIAAGDLRSRPALTYYRTVGKVVPGSDEAIASEAEYYEKVRNNIELLTLEQTLTHGGAFGSVDHVVDTLGRLATELGVSHYICWFRIPSLDRTLALKAMETFATEVLPQLRDTEPDSLAALEVASG